MIGRPGAPPAPRTTRPASKGRGPPYSPGPPQHQPHQPGQRDPEPANPSPQSGVSCTETTSPCQRRQRRPTSSSRPASSPFPNQQRRGTPPGGLGPGILDLWWPRPTPTSHPRPSPGMYIARTSEQRGADLAPPLPRSAGHGAAHGAASLQDAHLAIPGAHARHPPGAPRLACRASASRGTDPAAGARPAACHMAAKPPACHMAAKPPRAPQGSARPHKARQGPTRIASEPPK
jgi:hypothetical protein